MATATAILEEIRKVDGKGSGLDADRVWGKKPGAFGLTVFRAESVVDLGLAGPTGPAGATGLAGPTGPSGVSDYSLIALSPAGGGVLDMDAGNLVWDIDTIEQVTV